MKLFGLRDRPKALLIAALVVWLTGASAAAEEVPALYVTHDLRELAGLADRVAILEEGRIVQEGSLEVLRKGPVSDFIRFILLEEEPP